jgi:hypothetical protein
VVLSLLKLKRMINRSFSNAPGLDMKQSQNVHREKSPLWLVRRHPIASVFVLWVTLLLLAGLSTAALVNVSNSEESKIAKLPSTEPSTSEILDQSPQIEHQKQALPLLSFGAIALSCTLGCLILSQTFRSAGYQPVQRKTSRVRSSTPPQSTKFDDQGSLASPARSQSEGSFNMPSITSVTVVPKQQDHPLDWDEPSLADSLDMRQRRPLSHWL